MDTLSRLKETGESMGLSGIELQGFISEQQNILREERASKREQEKLEEEKAKRAFDLQFEKEKCLKEKEKLEHELLVERERTEQIKVKEHGLLKIKEMEMSMLELRTANSSTSFLDQSQATGNVAPKGPKIPFFDEEHDEMDSYLRRFERYAAVQAWEPGTWAIHLGSLLKGKALDVYSLLSNEKAKDYKALKTALLKRFDLTERGFRNRFRSCKPAAGESFTQFSVRLGSYLSRWVEMSPVEATYEGLYDLILRDQFLQVCEHDLTLFFGERVPKDIEQMSRLADQYKEARCISPTALSNRTAAVPKEAYSSRNFITPIPQVNRGLNNDKRCFRCGRPGHIATNCPARQRVASIQNAGTAPRPRQTPRGYVDEDGVYRSCDLCSESCNVFLPSYDRICDVSSSPVISYASNMYRDSGMPVQVGWVGNHMVKVLRDTGCSGIVVRREFVPTGQYTGREQTCLLADGTRIKVPVACVFIDSPYFRCQTEVWCMDNPLYDIIIGNVAGAREPSDPDMSRIISPVLTRQQAQSRQTGYSGMKVEGGIDIVDPEAIKEAQLNDHTLANIRDLVKRATPLKGKYDSETHYIIKRGLIHRRYHSPRIGNGTRFCQLVVPSKYRRSVLKIAHESIMSGHLGIERTVNKVLSEFFWPGVHADTRRFCQSCDVCQRTIPKGRVPKLPLGKMPVIDVPFRRVAVDIIGPLKPISTNGNRYILTLDYATRYPEAVALPSIEAERVAEALMDMFGRIGFPREMLTDMGSQFTSALMKEVSRLISLKQLTTTPYHPMCNGLVERFNGTLKQMLKRMCAERPKDWDRYLNALLFAYREVPQESLGYSPFELVYGWPVRGPMMILRELWTKNIDDPEVKTTYQYVLDLRERLETVGEMARDNLNVCAKKQKCYFDKRAKRRVFEVGDKALVLLPTKSNKLLLQWRGPFSVVEKLNDYDYRLSVHGKIKTFHGNLLKRYLERPQEDNHVDKVNAAVVDVEDDGMDSEPIQLPGTGKEGIDKVHICDKLNMEQRESLASLLNCYQDVLTDLPGHTNLLEHEINTTTDVPVRLKPYPIPFALTQVIDDELDKMLEMNVIESSNSNYSSPVVIVKKKDQTNRFCIDFRALNRVTIFDSEPIPNPEDMFARMAERGCRYLSQLDLSKGYWQVPMAETAKPLTAFQTPRGLFQFKVMPFGLVNAPVTFSRLMRKLLLGLENVNNFIDDITVYSETWVEHINILDSLFRRLRSSNLTVKPSKCFLGFDRIECLGFKVGLGCIEPTWDKLKVIEEAERPRTKKQVRSFLGLVGFYRRFIPNFSTIAVPLSDLTKKGRPNLLTWDAQQENAFQALKRSLIRGPVLRLPDLREVFILQTDASDNGIGAILLQVENEVRMPVAYASRKLKDSETRYSTIEKECLAIVWSIQKFTRYLYGVEFVLETDHQPLIYLNRSNMTNSRLMRWALILQPYRFRIEAIKGSANVGADYLSRIHRL
ncbi:hypothetical protein SNE40_023117 [Patella caerulea]|uniref:Reverse transcriptase n=1 Tax=Patella caerulea TaxID=87958 RepID=A0AAN8FXX4_PATCE